MILQDGVRNVPRPPVNQKKRPVPLDLRAAQGGIHLTGGSCACQRPAVSGPEEIDGRRSLLDADWTRVNTDEASSRGNRVRTVFRNAARSGSGTGSEGGRSRVTGFTGVPCFHSR